MEELQLPKLWGQRESINVSTNKVPAFPFSADDRACIITLSVDFQIILHLTQVLDRLQQKT